ncbi:hypothetical protein GCM10010465_05200 [Actinomadura fibrosa]
MEQKFVLETSVVPAEGGTVTPGQGEFKAAETLELTAVPAEGYRFAAWLGDYSGNTNPLEVKMSKNLKVVARFEEITGPTDPGPTNPTEQGALETIVIYTINDPHGRINNFAKIKAIIDKQKETESQVFFVCGGDIFSGNPIVDYHPEKGFPMIDLLGKSGLDVSALGNHEFDYGQEVLNMRMEQASFPFLCANVSRGSGDLNTPEGMVTIQKDGFEIAFIGVVETGSPDNTPLSHPKKIAGLNFTEGVSAVSNFENVTAVKNADLVVALTHYGSAGDRMILEQEDFVDLVIGGHNHAIYSQKVAGRYMVQSGSNLNYLTKLSLEVMGGQILDYKHELIDLNAVSQQDEELLVEINGYNNKPEFFEEIGTSLQNHSSSETGCFYTDALRAITGADIVFQNYGGIRAGLDYGPITPFDIYTIDPFGNGLDTFSMTVAELRAFLLSPNAPSMAWAGVQIQQSGGSINFYDGSGNKLADDRILVVGLNDYISSVYPGVFGAPEKTYEKTTAEYLIDYLKGYQSVIDYDGCNRGI